jgi:hypothetical protein
MPFLKSFIARVERDTGVPGRFIIPVLVASLSLTVALLGMYWDIGLPMTSDTYQLQRRPTRSP